MTDTALTAAEIEAAAALADDAAGDLNTQGKSVSTSMHGQAASFKGMTGSAFRMVLDEFMADLNVILQKLEMLSGATRNAANKLFDVDEQGAATVNRAASGGGQTTGVTDGLS